MSTRSKIGILRKDGTVDHVYSHWDGYPEHNGVILLSEYNNINKMNHLIKNGDMSILSEKIYPEPDKPHNFGSVEDHQELTYKTPARNNSTLPHHPFPWCRYR